MVVDVPIHLEQYIRQNRRTIWLSFDLSQSSYDLHAITTHPSFIGVAMDLHWSREQMVHNPEDHLFVLIRFKLVSKILVIREIRVHSNYTFFLKCLRG